MARRCAPVGENGSAAKKSSRRLLSDAAVRAAALPELLKAAAEQEKLFEHHAAARFVHVFPGFRAMDGGERVGSVRKAVFDAQDLGQRVGPVPRHRVERGFGHARHVALRQTGGQRIDRHDTAGIPVVFRDFFRLRRDHLPRPAEALHPAVKQIFLPDAKLRRDIGLIEPGDAERAAFVKDHAFDERHALAEAADLRLGAENCAHGISVLICDVRDACDLRAVLIVTRIGLQRVLQGRNMQFFEQLHLFRADALDELYAVCDGWHDVSPAEIFE